MQQLTPGFVVAVLVALLVQPTGLQAQKPQPPLARPGDVIRVEVGDTVHEGRLVRLGGDSVRWEPAGSPGTEQVVPLETVAQLRVLRGRARNTGQGAVVGLVLGGTMGYAAGGEYGLYCLLIAGDDDSMCDWPSRRQWRAMGLVGGTAAALGALIGTFHFSDRWHDVPLEPRVWLDPAAGTVGLRVVLRF
jgi:hypothetical protein